MMGKGVQLAVSSKPLSEIQKRFGMPDKTFFLVPNIPHGVYEGSSCSIIYAGRIFLIFVLFLISSNTLFAQTPNFDQLKNRFEAGEVFAAEFNHTYSDSYTGESTSNSGRIWIDQVRYKLQSDNQTIVVDGETSRVYDLNRNRVIIDLYDPDDDDFAPSRMLSGIDSTYAVSEQKQGGQTLIKLTSDDDFAVFAEVEIILDSGLRPQKITAWDISDNEVVTTFKNGRFYEPEPGLFKLDYPEDAEIVDMTY